LFSQEVSENSKKFLTLLSGTKFFGHDDDQKVGSEVLDTSYSRTMLATLFTITGEVIKSSGDRFFSINHVFTIPYFAGVLKLSRLPVQPMTDDVLQDLSARGKKFNSIARGPHYMVYRGVIYNNYS
jgi:hypothetical protein